MINTRKSMLIVPLLTFLIIIPNLVYAQSLSEMDRQIDEENLKKSQQVTELQKDPNFSKLNCPQGTYHGLDNQGIEACRDIETNQIVISDREIMTDSDTEVLTESDREKMTESGRPKMANSDREIMIDSAVGEIFLNDEDVPYVGIGILVSIGIVAGVLGLTRKQIKSEIIQRRDWSKIDKEEIMTSQFGRCNMCYKTPSRWIFDHFDGDKSNNVKSNVQGLCPNCYSEKKKIILNVH